MSQNKPTEQPPFHTVLKALAFTLNQFLLRQALRLNKFLPLAKLQNQLWNYHWQIEAKLENVEQSGASAEDLGGIRFSERATFIELIAAEYSFDSVLELGTAYGQNFSTLAKMFPAVQFAGFDLDKNAVASSIEYFNSLSLENVRFTEGDIRTVLPELSDNSVDVVIVAAVLLYLDREEVKQVFKQSARVARKSVVFLEQHEANESGASRLIDASSERPAYFLHDFDSILSELPSIKFSLSRVSKPRWLLEHWKSHSCVGIFRKTN